MNEDFPEYPETPSKANQVFEQWQKVKHPNWTKIYKDTDIREAFLAGWKSAEDTFKTEPSDFALQNDSNS